MNNLNSYRKSYEKSELLEDSISNDPIELYEKWFREVEASGGVDEVNAMTVATIGLDGFPKARVLLLKEFSSKGFVFYTNYNSEKGKSLANNPNICLSFFWHSMERQVIIKAVVEKTSAETSDHYFESRPHGSKLGAVVSNQSEVIKSRNLLDEKLNEAEQQYAGSVIKRPEHWGGYLAKPVEIEFWQGRANRLHDRIRYKLQLNNSWKIDRLSP